MTQRKPRPALSSFSSLLLALLAGLASAGAAARAAELDRCGRYVVQGRLETSVDGATLVVNPRSDSELRLRLRSKDPAQLSFYSRKWIEAQVRINTPGFAAQRDAELEGIPLILPSDRARRHRITRLEQQPCSVMSDQKLKH